MVPAAETDRIYDIRYWGELFFSLEQIVPAESCSASGGRAFDMQAIICWRIVLHSDSDCLYDRQHEERAALKVLHGD